MRTREHKGFGHGLAPGRDEDINCRSCRQERTEGIPPRITGEDDAPATRPMKRHELGRYVCVPSSACLLSPDITIRSDGLWVKTGQLWSSAHRACFESRQEGN